MCKINFLLFSYPSPVASTDSPPPCPPPPSPPDLQHPIFPPLAALYSSRRRIPPAAPPPLELTSHAALNRRWPLLCCVQLKSVAARPLLHLCKGGRRSLGRRGV